MIRVRVAWVLCVALVSVAQAGEKYSPGQKTNKTFKGFAAGFLENRCLDCHDDATKMGKLSLENLGPVDETNAGIWRSVWAQVTLTEMPPEDSDQPLIVERLIFSDWVVEELTRVMRDKGGFHAHRDPDKGNYVDHQLLFGPLPKNIHLTPTSSPARIWRVTPQEHITRLNELINTEPKYDPAKPGLRTHGDVVPTNHAGELKLYFGVDNMIRSPHISASYLTAVRSLPGVLASEREHGLENYPDFYSVNKSEATQIFDQAADIINYMAFGTKTLAVHPDQIANDSKNVKGTGGIVYSTEIKRSMTPVFELMDSESDSDAELLASVNYLFEALTFRPPTHQESQEYLQIVKQAIAKLGKKEGAVLGLSTIFLDRDALFRPETAATGTPDQHGRVMLQDWELGLAVNHALRYIKPDAQLKKAIMSGHMRNKEDVKREVARILADESIRKPRVIRFFREFFDYDLGGYICKDSKALKATGVSDSEFYYRKMFDEAASTDRLIELILKEDKDVFKQLLTTNKVVSTDFYNVHFGWSSDLKGAGPTGANLEKTKRYEILVNQLEKEIAKLELEPNQKDNSVKKILAAKKKQLDMARKGSQNDFHAVKRQQSAGVETAVLPGPRIYARASRRSFGSKSLKSDRILSTAPTGQRLGILTHPSWLVSHSDSMANHAIHRGKWIRERLLGGGIPDLPITVDAMLPDEPERTLRERMRVTRESYCWTCHQKMDPLGLPFEMYNHVGIYRTTESGKPVDTSGEIIDSGDERLDGKVESAIEMIQRLAESERVEQVFVRHAFRFWMGRNETLNDRPVLQAAHEAYKDSGGSMKALITSLLTSDAFLYRTVRPYVPDAAAGDSSRRRQANAKTEHSELSGR